jgi:hypothetical protein
VTVDVYDFDTSGPGPVYESDCGQADTATISQLAVNAAADAAWVLNPTPTPMPPELYVHDTHGTRQIDSGSITDVTLSGNTLTWDKGGTAETATLS